MAEKMKAESTVKRQLRSLRHDGIENTDDVVLRRVAQAVEYGIRWAREHTVGWPAPLEEAVELSKLIRREQHV